ncbi:hypothetical protein AAHC03_09552 [Spirometra sp. Aus1]
MLCDYESSVDDSTEEPQQVNEPTQQSDVPERSSPHPTSSSSSDEKSVDSPKRKPSLPRQYRSKRRSSRDKASCSRSRSSSSHRSRDRRDRHSERRDRHYRRRINRSSDRDRHRRRGSSRHRHRRSSGRHHYRSRSRHGSSSHRSRYEDKHCGPSRSRLTNGVTRRDLESRPEPKPVEPPKPIDPAVAAKEVAAKASAMIASAMSRNLVQPATDANGLPRVDPKDILAKIQETQLAQAKAQAEAAAVAANIPKFYNPLSVNAAKLAEQQQKRKLLWSKKTADKKEDEKSTMWKTTSMVAGKGDSAAAAKFCKLMGIHGAETPGSIALDDQKVAAALDKAQAQADLFRHLEREYENSRTITHTQRGVGLGYSSATHTDYTAYAALTKQRSTADNDDQGDAQC